MSNGALAPRRHEVENLETFESTSLYAKNVGDLYVVFSYRDDWPIYVHHPLHGWFENSDPPYSQTTARHMSAARPLGATLRPLSRDNMLALIARETALAR